MWLNFWISYFKYLFLKRNVFSICIAIIGKCGSHTWNPINATGDVFDDMYDVKPYNYLNAQIIQNRIPHKWNNVLPSIQLPINCYHYKSIYLVLIAYILFFSTSFYFCPQQLKTRNSIRLYYNRSINWNINYLFPFVFESSTVVLPYLIW